MSGPGASLLMAIEMPRRLSTKLQAIGLKLVNLSATANSQLIINARMQLKSDQAAAQVKQETMVNLQIR